MTQRLQPASRPSITLIMFAVIAVTMVIGAFLPGVRGPWQLDDAATVQYNQHIAAVKDLHWATWQTAWHNFQHDVWHRPLAMATFALNHVFSGMDPAAYKLTNILLHLFNTALVFVFGLKLLDLAEVSLTQRSRAGIALCMALLWALQPLQVSTVLYVVQRMEMLATTFMLLGLLAYLKGRSDMLAGKFGWLWMLPMTACVVLGYLCKETIALLPFYALLIEVCFLRFRSASIASTRGLRIAFAVWALAFTFLLVRYFSATGAMDWANREFGPFERTLTQFRVMVEYLGWSIWPFGNRLSFYHDDFTLSHGWLQPSNTLWSFILLVGLAASAVALRRRMPLYAYGVAFWFTSHLLTSAPVNLELVFEHRNYFALFGMVVAITGLVLKAAGTQEMQLTLPVRALGIGLVCLFAFGTFLRSSVWGDRLLFASDSYAMNPQSERAATAYSATLMGSIGFEKGKGTPFYDMAIQALINAAKLPYSSALPEHLLILAAVRAGDPVDPAWWAAIERKYRTSACGVENYNALSGLSMSFVTGEQTQNPAAMKKLFEAYVTKCPEKADAHGLYADFATGVLNDESLAAQQMTLWSKYYKGDPAFRAVLEKRLRDKGRLPEADAIAEAIRAH